jgi:predicted transcriptional regulator
METAFGMKPDVSNVVIIDPKGIIRYFSSGKLEDKDISVIIALLKSFKNTAS